MLAIATGLSISLFWRYSCHWYPGDVIAPAHTTVDAAALVKLIEDSGAAVLQATPSSLRMLLDGGWTGAPRLKVLCGGEAWTANLEKEILGVLQFALEHVRPDRDDGVVFRG